MTNILVQHARSELGAEQVELALSEVKERADVRIALTVVVAERALVVAEQLGYTIVGAQLPVFGERLVHFELHRLVDAYRIGKSVGDAVGAGYACYLRRSRRVEGIANAERVVARRISDRVSVAVYRRSINGS